MSDLLKAIEVELGQISQEIESLESLIEDMTGFLDEFSPDYYADLNSLNLVKRDLITAKKYKNSLIITRNLNQQVESFRLL